MRRGIILIASISPIAGKAVDLSFDQRHPGAAVRPSNNPADGGVAALVCPEQRRRSGIDRGKHAPARPGTGNSAMLQNRARIMFIAEFQIDLPETAAFR